jgi:hypothetical protein
MRRNKIAGMQKCTPKNTNFYLKSLENTFCAMHKKLLDKDVSVFIMGRMLQCSV